MQGHRESRLRVVFDLIVRRASTTQPFIRERAQSILVAGGIRVADKLSRGCIIQSSSLFPGQRGFFLNRERHSEICKQELVLRPQQDILRPDITVNQFLIMSVVQGAGDLPDITDNRSRWKADSFWIKLAQ